MVVQSRCGSFADIEFLQVKGVLSLAYVIFGNDVRTAREGEVACGPAVFPCFCQSVFDDLGIALSGGADVEIIVQSGVTGIGPGNQRRFSVPLFLPYTGCEMERAYPKVFGDGVKCLCVSPSLSVFRYGTGHKRIF